MAARGFALLVMLFGASLNLHAADLVETFFAGLNSFQSEFRQTVTDSNGEQVQDSAGTVWMQKPGRFRWDYQTPYRQLIVADGEHLWTYDEDLEQATVKPVDDALSSTPAMLLSGFRPLSEVMSWRQDASDGDAQWYTLDPRQADAAVETVRIAFTDGQLSVIEVMDGFGNHTRIQFSQIRRNQALDPALFQLQLPDGTDIIGDSP